MRIQSQDVYCLIYNNKLDPLSKNSQNQKLYYLRILVPLQLGVRGQILHGCVPTSLPQESERSARWCIEMGFRFCFLAPLSLTPTYSLMPQVCFQPKLLVGRGKTLEQKHLVPLLQEWFSEGSSWQIQPVDKPCRQGVVTSLGKQMAVEYKQGRQTWSCKPPVPPCLLLILLFFCVGGVFFTKFSH